MEQGQVLGEVFSSSVCCGGFTPTRPCGLIWADPFDTHHELFGATALRAPGLPWAWYRSSCRWAPCFFRDTGGEI